MSVDVDAKGAPAPNRAPLRTLGGWDFGRRIYGDYKAAIWAFAASRLVLLAIGLMTQVFIRPITTQGNPLQIGRHQALNIWGAWDAGWYVTLATEGYARVARADGQANWAFFPAYPSIGAAVSRLTGLSMFEALLVVSNASFLLALVLIHRLARAEFDKRTADISVVLLCAAPGSYVFSSAYTESLFIAALSGCLLLIRSRRWLAAGLVGGLAVLTRNLGIGLLLPFAWASGEQLWSERAGHWSPGAIAAALRQLARPAIGATIPLLAVAGFCAFLWAKTGDPLAFVHVQNAWGRSIGNPLAGPLRGLLHPNAIPDSDLISFAAAWLSLVLIVVLALMRRWMLLSLALFLTLVPLAAGLGSFARYSLSILPLWLAGARLLATRPAALAATVLVMATLNGFLMSAWALGLWVTA